MSSHFSRSSVATLGAAAALALAATLATAQPGPGRRPGRPAGESANDPRPSPLRRALAGLTAEQRATVREALTTARLEGDALREKMRAAQKELHEAIVADKTDEAAVKAKAEVVGKLAADLAMVRAKAVAKVRPALKPEQWERLKRLRPEAWQQMRQRVQGRFGVPQRGDRPQPRAFQQRPRFQGPPRFRPQDRFQGGRGAMGPPWFQRPPRLQGQQGFQGPPRFQRQQGFQGPPRYQRQQGFQGPRRFQGPPSWRGPWRWGRSGLPPAGRLAPPPRSDE